MTPGSMGRRCKHCRALEPEFIASGGSIPCTSAEALHEFVNAEYYTEPAVLPPAQAETPTEPIDRLIWLLSNQQNEATMLEKFPVPELARAIAALEQVKSLRGIDWALHRILDYVREMRWGQKPTQAPARDPRCTPTCNANLVPGAAHSCAMKVFNPPRDPWKGTYHTFKPGGYAGQCWSCAGGEQHWIHQEGR